MPRGPKYYPGRRREQRERAERIRESAIIFGRLGGDFTSLELFQFMNPGVSATFHGVGMCKQSPIITRALNALVNKGEFLRLPNGKYRTPILCPTRDMLMQGKARPARPVAP